MNFIDDVSPAFVYILLGLSYDYQQDNLADSVKKIAKLYSKHVGKTPSVILTKMLPHSLKWIDVGLVRNGGENQDLQTRFVDTAIGNQAFL